jgi:hypothetical protein
LTSPREAGEREDEEQQGSGGAEEQGKRGKREELKVPLLIVNS